MVEDGCQYCGGWCFVDLDELKCINCGRIQGIIIKAKKEEKAERQETGKGKNRRVLLRELNEGVYEGEQMMLI